MGLNIGQVDPQTIQKLLFGGPQSMFAPPSEGAPPQAEPSAPQRGSVAQAMQSAPPPAPAEPTAAAASPTPQASQPGYSTTPPSFDEYHTSHGDVPLKAPAPAPKHGMLAKIMLGLGEAVGNPLATRIGESDRKLGLENQEFERNRPALQYSTNRAAYEQDIGNMQKVAETRKANIDADLAQQNLPMQKEAEIRFNELKDAWQNKAIPPEQFESYANVQLSAMPPAIARMVQPHIADIKTLPQTGKGYKLNMQDDLPVSVEAYGKTYQPDKSGNFPPEVPPQAVQDFKAAQQAHGTKRGEKLADEKEVAQLGGEAQGRGFAQAEKMKALGEIQPRINTALDANERLSRMEASYEKAKNGDQQAQLALLADHIGMTFGLQKNVRANKALIQEAQASQPWLQKIGAKFDDRGFLSGVALGPDQMKQMLDLGYGARDRAFQSAHEAATSYGQPLPSGFEKVEGQRQPGAKPALDQSAQQQHVPGGKAQGLQEGQTGTGSDGKKYVVRNGAWASQ